MCWRGSGAVAAYLPPPRPGSRANGPWRLGSDNPVIDFNDIREVALYLADQPIVPSRGTKAIHLACQDLKRSLIRRNSMSLAIVIHLEPVFESSQIGVSGL